MRTYPRRFRESDLPVVLNLELRQSDKDELKASVGLDPADAILISLLHSTEKWVVVHDNKIEAVFGVSWVPERQLAVPWFLGTDKIEDYSITFIRQSKKIVEDWLDRYGVLFNLVDSRHTASIRWLKWLGFTVDEEVEVTLSDPNVPFYRFFKLKEADDSV